MHPTAVTVVAVLFAAATTAASASPQGGDPTPAEIAEARERFASLSNLRKAMVVRSLHQRIAEDPDPLLQTILGLAVLEAEPHDATPLPMHDPAVHAPGAAPARRRIGPDDPAQRPFRDKLRGTEFLPDLAKRVVYEWHTGRIVRVDDAPGFDALFDDLLRGYPPGADIVVARVLAALDADPRERQAAAYFGHVYADLDARAYDGLSLYDAWSTALQVDVPDVDAIPFAVTLLGDRSFRSPIPADAKRTALYVKIKERATAHRTYRTLREAAAASLVHATPKLDPTYAPLVPRFHYLFATNGDDLAAFTAAIGRITDRDRWIDDLDASFKKDRAALALRDRRTDALAALGRKLRRLAVDTVTRGR